MNRQEKLKLLDAVPINEDQTLLNVIEETTAIGCIQFTVKQMIKMGSDFFDFKEYMSKKQYELLKKANLALVEFNNSLYPDDQDEKEEDA